MKKHLITLLLALTCSITPTLAQAHESCTDTNTSIHIAPRGYRGTVEIAPIALSVEGLAMKFNTTHGFQFNHNLFLGGGLGIVTYYNSDKIDIPVYIAIQSNVGEKMAQFTYGGRLGVSVYSKHYGTDPENIPHETVSEGAGPLYLNLNLGLRLGFSPQYAMTIKPELEVIYWGLPSLNFGINVGFEFR